MLAAATQALKLRQCTLKRFAPHGTLRLTGLHRREHARCIAILHRARQPRWWQLCPALAVIDPGPAAVLTDLIIEVTSEPQLRRIQNGRCVEHRLGWLALDQHRRTTRPEDAGLPAADRLTAQRASAEERGRRWPASRRWHGTTYTTKNATQSRPQVQRGKH